MAASSVFETRATVLETTNQLDRLRTDELRVLVNNLLFVSELTV